MNVSNSFALYHSWNNEFFDVIQQTQLRRLGNVIQH